MLGAVLAERLLVLAAHDGEGVHDVGDGIARLGEMAFELGKLFGCFVLGAAVETPCGPPVAMFVGWKVQVEEGGVQLATEEEAAVLVPAERWTVVADVASKTIEIVGRVRQLQDARNDEFDEIRFFPERYPAVKLEAA